MIFSYLENGQVKKRETPSVSFDLECDVLVVGAGSAGIYASDAAARMGSDVILCEIGENIGGMTAAGSVTRYYYGMSGGSFEADDEISLADTVFLSNNLHWELRQIRFVERLKKSGVRTMCNLSPVGIFFEGNRAVGISAHDGNGFVNIKAQITVDATSDGHLIRMTDVKKRYGRAQDGSFVPFTARIQYTKDGRLCYCNEDSGITDHYDAKDFSEKVILSHANASALMNKGELVNIAFQTGIREGLTFEGEEELRLEDVLFNKSPEKVLFWAYSDLDRHGNDRATETELFQNWWVVSNLATVTATIPVPMGSVVPKGLKGMISAGRCFSCDTYTQSAVRMNKDMFRMGECIGVAAALACRDNVEFLDIDYDEFLKTVKALNCFDGNFPHGFYFDNRYDAYLRKMEALKRTPDPKYSHLSSCDYIRERIVFDLGKTAHLLKTDSPGVAFWSCFVSENRDEVCETLNSEMTGADGLYRYNCAIALGLLGDRRALAVLREIIMRRDCFFFKDNRRSNQFRTAVAICLIGRLGTLEDAELLFEFFKEKEYENQMYHTLSADYLYHSDADRNFVYFTMITHAAMALYHIYKRNGLDFDELNRRFEKFFGCEKNIKNITEEPAGSPAQEELQAFISYLFSLMN